MIEYDHVSVLKNEAIQLLDIKKGNIYIDATFGAGGHSKEIIKLGGKVIGLDRDESVNYFAQKIKNETIEDYFSFYNINFTEIKNIINNHDVSGILYDFGVSSMQLDNKDRGFSFQEDAILDMRMSKNNQNITALDVINSYSEKNLADIIYKYGDEKFAFQIAKKIITERNVKQIRTTKELEGIIFAVFKKKYNSYSKINPATKTFQAIRIEVNDELKAIERSIEDAINFSKSNTKIVCISFHSGEDSIIKSIFRKYSGYKENIMNKNINPFFFDSEEKYKIKKDKVEKIKILTKKIIIPSEEEVEKNPRSRSAKLRACEII